MPNEILRIGLLGLQHEEHVRGFYRTVLEDCPKCELVAVAEPEKRRRESLDSRGLRLYTNAEEMLESETLDAVFVDTVYSKKAAAVCLCLEHGIPLLANKPLCTTLAQLETIVKAYRANRGILSLQLTERFNAPFVAVKKAVNDGLLGDVLTIQAAKPHRLHRPGVFTHGRPDWMFTRKHYGGILVDLGIHDVDLARWITGQEVERVVAVSGVSRYAQEHPDFSDYGMMFLSLTSGKCASLEADWLSSTNTFTITGTEGTAYYPGPDERFLYRIERDGETLRLNGARENPFAANTKHFLSCVKDAHTPQPAPYDVFMSTLVTLLAQESVDKNGEMQVSGTPLFVEIQNLRPPPPCSH